MACYHANAGNDKSELYGLVSISPHETTSSFQRVISNFQIIPVTEPIQFSFSSFLAFFLIQLKNEIKTNKKTKMNKTFCFEIDYGQGVDYVLSNSTYF